MNAYMTRLLRWGLGRQEARAFILEFEELYQVKVGSEGPRAADRWRRRELRRACFHAIRDRLSQASARPRARRRAEERRGLALLLDGARRDLSFGLRILRRRPTFAALGIGLLGLGIGTFTVTFSLVEGVLLRDLPYEGKGELVKIWQTYPQWQGQEGRDEFWDKVGLNWEEVRTLREKTNTLRTVAAFRTGTMVLTGGGTPQRLDVGEASAGLFPLLGVRMQLGRAFLPGEEGPDAARLTVISYELWTSQFGHDPEILGRSVTLDGEPFEVVGVLPRGFRLRSSFYNLFNQTTDSGARALWVPIHLQGTGLGAHDMEGVGRLSPGSSVSDLQSELGALLAQGRGPDQLGFRVTHPRQEITAGYRPSLLLLMATSVLLLLIACASIAALFVSEATGRAREIATRIALGANGPAVLRQFLSESLVIGALGALLGLVLAWGGLVLLGRMAPPLPRMEEVGLNPSVVFAAVLAGAGTSVLFGLAPVSLRSRGSLRGGLGKGDRGSTGGGGKIQKWIIGAELAFTVVLLVDGGLLTRSLVKLTQVDPGFEADGVATVHVPFPTAGVREPGSSLSLYRALLERVRSIPGVETAGAVDGLPFPGIPTGDTFELVGREGFITPRDHIMLPGYLETLGIPLLAGRGLSEGDLGAEGIGAALINETMARLYWPDRSPLGARIRQGPLVFEIVGIVGDVPEARLSAAPLPTVYRCGPRVPPTGMSIVARAKGEPRELVGDMRRAIWSVDPDLPLTQETTVADLVTASTVAERYRSVLVMIVAVLAALIAATGVFAVTAHTLSRRNRELGIRKALGATGVELLRGVVGETMVPSALGIGVGLLGALASASIVERFVFGIEAWDALTFSAVAILLFGLSLLAGIAPALGVARIEPMTVIRDE